MEDPNAYILVFIVTFSRSVVALFTARRMAVAFRWSLGCLCIVASLPTQRETQYAQSQSFTQFARESIRSKRSIRYILYLRCPFSPSTEAVHPIHQGKRAFPYPPDASRTFLQESIYLLERIFLESPYLDRLIV